MSRVFACCNKEISIRRVSSSGGIYYLVAEEILKKGGVVYGASYEGLEVAHQRAETTEQLIQTCGSKYIPSELRDTFQRIKEDLEAGKQVLFTGLPCQCGGLLSFVGKNDNLFCMDVVCHSLPGKKAWMGYVNALNQRGFELVSVNMRDKSTGWKGYSWKLVDGVGERYEPHGQNIYMKGFIADLYSRPSCSHCSFKGIERPTDITLGDYWGIQNIQPEMDDDMGTSIAFIHTEKGAMLFKQIAEKIAFEEAPVDEVIRYNPSIVKISQAHKNRREFFEYLLKEEDFIDMVQKLTRKQMTARVKTKVKNTLKKIGGGY